MNNINKLRCNICGLPEKVTYQEHDAETGTYKKVTHGVDCLGHEGVLPYLWNRAAGNTSCGIRSLGFDEYQKPQKKGKKENV